MSDIRFNQWLHQSGTGGVSQDHIGNIGIGTTNPSIVVSAANTAVLNVGVITANNLFVNNAFNGDITGNVTGNISGATGTFSGNVDIADKIIHTGDTDTAMRFPADNTFAVDTAGSERLRITSAGRLGLGTDNPSVNLHVKGSASNGQIYLGGGTGAHSQIYADNDGVLILNADQGNSAANSYLGFNVDNTERLRIRSDGRVTIGAQVINTNSMLSIHRGSSDESQIRFTNTTTGEGGNNGLLVGIDSNEHGRIFNQENAPLRFGTNNTERLRIGSGGNLALGGQNTSAYSGHTNFFLGGIANLYAETTAASTGSLSVSNNAYINSSGNWVYRVNGKATNLYQYDGGYGFRTVGTGSAGGTISWTETLTITSGGHVLPGANNTYDLGSTAKGWRNVYMNDLNLSNMNGDTNDVDGTQGSWTIQEGKDDLYIINRLNGKKFKIKMEEIS